MDNYTLFLIKNTGIKHDITKIISNLSWQDDIATLGVQLTFTVAKYKKDILSLIEEGDKLLLINSESETFRGIIINRNIARFEIGITAFDYAFYLNKSEVIMQFKKMDAVSAITKIASKAGALISAPASAVKVTKIYKDKTVGAIIQDILEQISKETGKVYFYEMVQRMLYIRELGFETIEVKSPIGADATSNRSIQELKNSIIVTSDNEASERIVAKAQDKEAMKKYGLLQKIIQVDSKDMSKANNIAKNTLKELNKVEEDTTIPILGADYIRCGRLTNLDIEELNLKGKFLIKSTQHSYQNSIHRCSITVERWAK